MEVVNCENNVERNFVIYKQRGTLKEVKTRRLRPDVNEARMGKRPLSFEQTVRTPHKS
jgi:hypothetical protein